MSGFGERRISDDDRMTASNLGMDHEEDGRKLIYDPMELWGIVMNEPRDQYAAGEGNALLAAYKGGASAFH